MTSFADRPLFDFEPDFEQVQHGQLDDNGLKSVGFGTATPWKPTTKTKRTITLPFLFANRAEWRAFRDFIAARRGILQGFWLPLWLTDYPSLQHTAGQPLIDIEPIGLEGRFVAGEQFAFCALITKNASTPTIEPHEISSVTPVSGYERITLATNIVGTFPVESSVLCGLIYARLADARVEYEFLTDEVVRAEVQFVELPREYETANAVERPVVLFELTRAGTVWRFANWGETIVFNDVPWIGENITHGDLKRGLDFFSEDFEVNFGTDRTDHPLLYHLRGRGATLNTTLRVFIADAGATTFDDTAPIYSGRVERAEEIGKGVVRVNCSSIFRVTETMIPKPQIQRFCVHKTGDGFCQLNLATITTAGTITAVGTDYIEADEFGAKATAEADPHWFALGKVTVGNEVRLCTGQVGNRLYLDLAFDEAEVGAAASAIAGDDHRIQTCLFKFNNLANFLGGPYVPNRNPQFQALEVPKSTGGKKA